MSSRSRDRDRSRHEPDNKQKVNPVEHKLFLGGLPVDFGDDDLRKMFEQYGELLTAFVLKGHDGRSRSFGFVKFATKEGLDDAMRSRPHKIRNRELESRRAYPREFPPEQAVQSKKIFVGGCRGPIDETVLSEYFSKYGKIVSVDIIRDRDRVSKGFGFIEFDDYDPVDQIILEQKEHTIQGRILELRKYLSQEQMDKFKEKEPERHRNERDDNHRRGGDRDDDRGRRGDNRDHDRGYFLSPQIPPLNYVPPPPMPFGMPNYGEPERVPLWERLFGLSDEERAHALMTIEEDYFIRERERLERPLRELDRLEHEWHRVMSRNNRGGNDSYRERSPIRGSQNYDVRRDGRSMMPPTNDYYGEYPNSGGSHNGNGGNYGGSNDMSSSGDGRYAVSAPYGGGYMPRTVQSYGRDDYSGGNDAYVKQDRSPNLNQPTSYRR